MKKTILLAAFMLAVLAGCKKDPVSYGYVQVGSERFEILSAGVYHSHTAGNEGYNLAFSSIVEDLNHKIEQASPNAHLFSMDFADELLNKEIKNMAEEVLDYAWGFYNSYDNIDETFDSSDVDQGYLHVVKDGDTFTVDQKCFFKTPETGVLFIEVHYHGTPQVSSEYIF